MLAAFDVLLIVIAVIIMMAGFARRRSRWQMGQQEDRKGDLGGLTRYLLGHKEILKKPSSGVAHVILLWGVVVPLVVIILTQFGFTMPKVMSNVLSSLTDVLGTAMLVGTVFFLTRRIRGQDREGPRRTLLPILVLLFILLTGFLAEGARLRIVHPTFAGVSPVGWLFSLLLPDSPRFMQLMIRCHFFLVLFFIAILPFTFMRHLAATSLNVYYRKQATRGELREVPFDRAPLGAATVSDFSWKQLLDAEACVACGRCEENCPASISGKPLSPRKVMRNIMEQMEEANQHGSRKGGRTLPHLEDDITADEIWACTNCMACVGYCPVFIEPMEKIIDMRRYRVMEQGLLPEEARPMIRNLEIYGDVQGKGMAHRVDWAFNRGVPTLYEDGTEPEILLWIGCSGAFHPRYREVTRAMVEILKAGGVQFATLGKKELCCGDPARRLGEESLFLDLARKNISCLQKYGVQKIVALCPHCYNTLKNEYPVLGFNSLSNSMIGVEVLHAVELMGALIEQKRISLKYPVTEKIALHDPCYLGRVNHVYEPLREVMQVVPGIELKELKRNYQSSLCCGGGGGRMWLHERLGRRINQIRSEEVVEAGVDAVGTACPYCLTMLEDGVKSIETVKPPKVFDIIEVIASSLG